MHVLCEISSNLYRRTMTVVTIIFESIVAVSIFWISCQYKAAGNFTEVIIKATVTLNVTPCYGIRAYMIDIVNESLARAEADYSCRETGYDGLLTTKIDRQTWYHIRAVLQNVNYAASNVSFWEGRFRPFFHIFDWYGAGMFGDNALCTLYGKNEVSGTYLPSAQCAAVQWKTLSFQHDLEARDCYDTLPYICVRYDGYAHFEVYRDYMMSPNNVLAIRFSFNETIVTYDGCAQYCRGRLRCIAFTFNHSSSNCTLTNLMHGNGPVTYEISPGWPNVTHGIKTGCSVIFNNTSRNISLAAVNHTLPVCGLSPIPSNYCQCECGLTADANYTMNEVQLERIVDELILNLTVSERLISARRRKLTSATDERPSATFIGALGAVFLTTVFSLPVISDILSLKWNIRRQNQNGRSKRETKFKRVRTSIGSDNKTVSRF